MDTATQSSDSNRITSNSLLPDSGHARTARTHRRTQSRPQLAPKELPHTVIPTAFVSACLLTHVTKGGGFNSRQSSLSLERAVAAMKVRAPDRKWSVFSGFSAFQMRMGGRLCLHPMGAAISNRNTCRNLLQYRSLQLHPSTAEQLNCFF